jgi:hypothetical protein
VLKFHERKNICDYCWEFKCNGKKKIRQQFYGKITSNTLNIKVPIQSQKYKQDGH